MEVYFRKLPPPFSSKRLKLPADYLFRLNFSLGKGESLELSLNFNFSSLNPFLFRRLEEEGFFSTLASISGKRELGQVVDSLRALVSSIWIVYREESSQPQPASFRVSRLELYLWRKGSLLEVEFKLKGRQGEEFTLLFLCERYLNGDSIFEEWTPESETSHVEELISRERRFIVFVVDIYQFSKVNDVFGLSNGDRILFEALKRLKRALEGQGCRVFKSYSDRFVVVCEGGKERASELLRRILGVFDYPFEVNGEKLYLSVNVGVAFFPEHGRSVVSKAEIAQREAFKRNMPFLVFSGGWSSSAGALEVLTKVKEDLRRGRIGVHLQPKVELQTFKIVGAEALMRCSVPPSLAVPVIVEHGLIYEVGRRVLEEAFKAARVIRDGGFSIPVSVNVSSVQLADRQFIDFVKELLLKYSLEGRDFIFEITESEASQEDGLFMESIERLRELGICISIDDFGMGYSSLSRLKMIKACELKIDKAFVKDIDREPEVLGIVKLAVGIASLLSMKSVAEGIERLEQVEILRRIGCEEGQGFLFSPPLPLKELLELLKEGHLRPK